MREILTSEIAVLVGKLLIEWGMPGVIILFLYEERRRLMKEINSLQNRLNDSLEARIKTNVDALTTVKDNENAIEKMSELLKTLLLFSNRRNGRDE